MAGLEAEAAWTQARKRTRFRCPPPWRWPPGRFDEDKAEASDKRNPSGFKFVRCVPLPATRAYEVPTPRSFIRPEDTPRAHYQRESTALRWEYLIMNRCRCRSCPTRYRRPGAKRQRGDERHGVARIGFPCIRDHNCQRRMCGASGPVAPRRFSCSTPHTHVLQGRAHTSQVTR